MTHLAKAKAALAAASEMDVELDDERAPIAYLHLTEIARTQAAIAQAEALETQREVMETIAALVRKLVLQ